MKQSVTIALAVLWNTCALAQVFQGFPPAQPPLSGNEQIPADTGANPPSEVISTGQLAQFVTSFDPGQNWLIAGDAGQNLWQRGVTGPVATTSVLFGPDRWAYWSGTSTPMVVSKDLTAGVTPPGFNAAYKMQRQSGATGVSPLCLTQELSSTNSVSLQGKFVELDFNVFGGPNVSSPLVRIFVVVGTGVNEGVGKLAFGLNGGGGGSVGWTGQANVVSANFSPIAAGALVHPAVVGRLPINETEVGVALCAFPSGTAGAGDYLDFSGVQMRLAPALASFASAVTAYAAQALQVPPFIWRLGNQEALLQQAYYWQRNEGAGLDVIGPNCRSVTALRADCFLLFPVPMGQTPSMAFVPGFATDANSGGLEACTGLAVSPGMVATVLGVTIGCAAGSNVKAASFLYENGGSGVISADAELH